MSIRLLFSILLLSISCNSIYAESSLKIKTWSFSVGGETKAPKNNYSSEGSGSTYFYAAPNYEGVSWGGFFVPWLQYGKHHLWWNTGSILLSGSAGYRHVLANEHFSQNWFWGIYGGYGYHGHYKLNDEKAYYRANVGLEIGGSKFGQLTINLYPSLDKEIRESFSKLEVWNPFDDQFINSELIDNMGISCKWVSTPKRWGIQLSAAGAMTNVYGKKRGATGNFKKEYVGHFGVGCELNLSSWAYIECRWTLIDKYKPISLIPSFGIKFIGVKPHLAKDTFQGRLKRPSQPYAPMYGFKWNDWLSCFDSVPGSNKRLGSDEDDVLLSSARDLQAPQSIFRNMRQIQNPGDLQHAHFQDGNIMEPWQKELNQLSRLSRIWEAAGKPIDLAAFENAESSEQLAELIAQEKMTLNRGRQAIMDDKCLEDKAQLVGAIDESQRELDRMLKEIEIRQQKIEIAE